MGLFNKLFSQEIKSTPFLFSFVAPYDLATTRRIIYEALWSLEQYQDQFGRPVLMQMSEPPLSATQYVSKAEDNELVITAGNAVSTYWNVAIKFAERDGATYGEANIDRRKIDIGRWKGNVHKLALYLPDVLSGDYGFTVRSFDRDDLWMEVPRSW